MIKITDDELRQIVNYLNELEDQSKYIRVPLISLIDSLSMALPENCVMDPEDQ